jgi:hypothetical protein
VNPIVLRIEPKGDRGRSFSATLLASAEADPLWEGGRTSGDTRRPVLLVLAGSETELRPFVANLLTSRAALFNKKDRLEILKSAGYETFWQRHPEGAIATLYLPELLDLDPGMVEPTGARFVCLAGDDWLRSDPVDDLRAVVSHAMRASDHTYDFRDWPGVSLDTLAPVSRLFAAMLDRRTRCPIVADPRFHLQLLVAALREGLASLPRAPDSYGRETWFKVRGAEHLGFATPVAFGATHERVEALLAEETARYFDVVGDRSPKAPRSTSLSAVAR